MQASSTVESGVDDYAFTVGILAENVGIYGSVGFIVHGFEMHISESSSGYGVDNMAITLQPAIIEHGVVCAVVGG